MLCLYVLMVSGTGVVSVWHVADQDEDRQHSSRSGRKKKADQEIGQREQSREQKEQ